MASKTIYSASKKAFNKMIQTNDRNAHTILTFYGYKDSIIRVSILSVNGIWKINMQSGNKLSELHSSIEKLFIEMTPYMPFFEYEEMD